MSRHIRPGYPARDSDEHKSNGRSESPSIGAMIAGVAGLIGAVGLGYLLGSEMSKDEEEEHKQSDSQAEQHRRQQQRQQQQRQRERQEQQRPPQYPAQYRRPISPVSQPLGRGQAARAYEQMAHSQSATVRLDQPANQSNNHPIAHPVKQSGDQPAMASTVKSSKSASDLEDALLCKVCYDREINSFFAPCRHSCCCIECGDVLEDCPVCRTPIEAVEQIYRS